MVAPVSVEDLRVRQALPLQGEEIGGRFGVLPDSDATGPECLPRAGAELEGKSVRLDTSLPGSGLMSQLDVTAYHSSMSQLVTADDFECFPSARSASSGPSDSWPSR